MIGILRHYKHRKLGHPQDGMAADFKVQLQASPLEIPELFKPTHGNGVSSYPLVNYHIYVYIYNYITMCIYIYMYIYNYITISLYNYTTI